MKERKGIVVNFFFKGKRLLEEDEGREEKEALERC